MRRLILGPMRGVLLVVLLLASGGAGVAETVAACGIKCGGPHPTPRPIIRYLTPAPRPAQVAAQPTAKPAPTKAPTARPAPAAVIVPPRPAAPPPAPTARAATATAAATALPSVSAQVKYVVQANGLSESRSMAKEMRDVLLANGYKQVKTPATGGIVLFMPAYFTHVAGYDAMKREGLIGTLAEVVTETDTTYRVRLHTALDNPPVEALPAPAEEGFSNLFDLTLGPYGRGQVAVLYFTRS